MRAHRTPRVILHIGQQKTGTTALQLALVADRDRLLDSGFLYPMVGHLKERRSDRPRPSHNGLFYGLEGQSTSRLELSVEEMRAAFETERESSKAHTVILSAERAFQAVDHRPGLLERLDDAVPGRKQVVAYLRRPDRYVVSFHKHDIRMGARVAGLHTHQRMERLEHTSRLDHRSAVGVYADRYGGVELYRYEAVGDTVRHFYETVLGLEPPLELVARANRSVPAVLTNLMRKHVLNGGRLERPQIRSLVRFGEREPVDLLGRENRDRLVSFYGMHNEYLGALAGRATFFADLDEILHIGAGTLAVTEADRRYAQVFAALVTRDVRDLRNRCRAWERRGSFATASDVFEAVAPRLGQADLEWFRDALERSTDGLWSIRRRRYAAREGSGT